MTPWPRCSVRVVGHAMLVWLLVAGGGSALTVSAFALSSECQEAMANYLKEERWLSAHFDEDLPLDVFARHEARMKRAWTTSELDCGVDVDQDGIIGYPLTRPRA